MNWFNIIYYIWIIYFIIIIFSFYTNFIYWFIIFIY